MHDQPNILYYRSAASRSTCRSSAPSSSFFLNVSNSSMHSDSSLERHDVIFFTILFFSLHRLHRAELCSFSAKKNIFFLSEGFHRSAAQVQMFFWHWKTGWEDYQLNSNSKDSGHLSDPQSGHFQGTPVNLLSMIIEFIWSSGTKETDTFHKM